jgi:peroxiredoxin Q/BCP
MTLALGTPAPQFTLPDQDGKRVSLKDFQGKWLVLYFYPKDDTPGCTIEGIEFTTLKKEFEKRNTVVYGISGDDAESHCAFQKKHGLSIPLLTDKEKKMMTAYGAFKQRLLYGNSFLGIIRSTVLIDPEGVVAHHWPTVKAQGHAEEVVERLTELQA